MGKTKRLSVTITELEDGYFAEINAGWRKKSKVSSDSLEKLLRKVVVRVGDALDHPVLAKDIFEES